MGGARKNQFNFDAIEQMENQLNELTNLQSK